MNAITVDNITVSYGDRIVLEDISLDIADGEFAGVIGPNGSGKTTLIRTILGLVEPDSGSISVFGQSPDTAQQSRDIGYVPQEYPRERSFPATVFELLRATGYREGDMEEMLESLGIDPLMGQQFSELSGGQQQRVMVAMALVRDPRLLILDEPSVGVDVSTQRRFYEFLQHINEERNVTILLVSHDTSMLSEFSKSVVCINRTVCGHGSSDEIGSFLDEVYGKEFKHVHANSTDDDGDRNSKTADGCDPA